MTILVTGGAGFIGSCFIRYMLKKYPDYKIINLDALTYCGNLLNLQDIEHNKNYTFIKGDICDYKLVKKIFLDKKYFNCNANGGGYIVNFAAQTHVDNSIKSPEIFIKTNVQGTLNLLQIAKEFNINKFLQISTDEVYGSLGASGYFDESSPLAPNSPYSASKASADLLVRAYFKTYNLPVLITRCSNNYGPYQYPEKLIPFFIFKLLKNEKIPIYGDGLNIRDWLFVYDHCAGIDLVLHKGKIGEIYNIGGHNEKTNLQIAHIILKAMGKDESYIEFVKDRLGHDRRYAICNDKISNLGFKPSVLFEEGINSTINWYLNNQNWIKQLQKVKNDDQFFAKLKQK